MFLQDSRIRCQIGNPSTIHGKEHLQQVIPCVFTVPLSEAEEQMDLPLREFITGLEKHVVNPHIQGKLPVEDEDEPRTFQIWIWPGSDNDLEQEEHYKKKPLSLDDAMLSRLTAYPVGAYEGSISIKVNITVPYRSEALAGQVDKLAGESVRMQLTELQTELSLPRE